MTISSSSSFVSILVLCLIVASLMTPSMSNPLAKVCSKSKNPRFCLQVLGLKDRSPYELTQEAIKLALANASETTKKIYYFLDQTEDDNLKVIYDYCLYYYNSAIDALGGAEEHFLKKGLYSGVKITANFAQKATFYCENEFQRIIGYVYASTLTKENENFEIFGSIIMAAVDLLSNPTSVIK